MVDRALYWAAHDELMSLRKHAKITGCDLRELISIPADVRAGIEAFIKAYPRDSEDLVEALWIRDWMLERV